MDDDEEKDGEPTTKAVGMSISQGCKYDCMKLIMGVATTDLKFSDFIREWRRLNFHQIFSGREPDSELPEFVRQLFSVVKMIMLESTLFEKKAAALYLLYALYYSQPGHLKIRFTPAELDIVMGFIDEVKVKRLDQAQFVFYKLFVDNAFHFCATSSEHVFLSKQTTRVFMEEERVETEFLGDGGINENTLQLDAMLADIDVKYATVFPQLFADSEGNYLNRLQQQIRKLLSRNSLS